MNTQDDRIDEASNDSFPASDPPAGNAATGVGEPYHFRRVRTVDGKRVIDVERGRGESLHDHLATYGIDARLDLDAEGLVERVELTGEDDTETVQEALDQWIN